MEDLFRFFSIEAELPEELFRRIAVSSHRDEKLLGLLQQASKKKGPRGTGKACEYDFFGIAFQAGGYCGKLFIEIGQLENS